MENHLSRNRKWNSNILCFVLLQAFRFSRGRRSCRRNWHRRRRRHFPPNFGAPVFRRDPQIPRQARRRRGTDVIKLFFDETVSMEQHTFKNVNICLNTNIYSYLETSGGQSSNLYLNVVHFFNPRVNQTSVAA